MRKSLGGLGPWTLLAFVLLRGASLDAQSADAVQTATLENGLQVIVVPNHTTPIVALEVVVRAGAFTQVEPPDEGLPHILEHLLFRVYSDGEGFAADVAESHGTYSGATGEEMVAYFIVVPAAETRRGIELLANLMQDPSFFGRARTGRTHVEEEVQVVRGELERVAADPTEVLDHVSDMALWGPAFRRKNAIGNVSTILGAQADRLRDHYRKYYVPNNAALVVSGDVLPDQVFEWARDGFRSWDESEDPFVGFTPPQIDPLTRDTAFVIEMPAANVTLMVKWQGPSISADPTGASAAEVFSSLVNRSGSPTQRRLVDTGILQGVTLAYRPQEYVGPIQLVARTTPQMLGRALMELGVELWLLGDPDYFDEYHLGAAKNDFRLDRALVDESVVDAGHTIASHWAMGGLDYHSTYDRGLHDVTATGVRAFVQRYIVGAPRVIAVLASPEIAESLAPILPQVVARWPGGQP
jgi:zinc protease